MKPDDAIYKQVMLDIDEYTGQQGNFSSRFEAYPYPQRLSKLSEIIRGHTLRECGKIKRFLNLQQAVFDLDVAHTTKADRTIYSIIEWLDKQMEETKPVTGEGEPLVIFLLLFGGPYLNRMLNYNFQSLMAKGNLPAFVKERKVVFYLVTDEKSRQTIESAWIVKRMKEIGVLFDYALLPDEIVAAIDEPTTYWLLGAAASLALQYAKALNGAFHHSYADAIYSEKFLTEVLRLSKEHKTILGQAIRADEVMFVPKMLPYRGNDGELSIPAPDLIALHMNCLHQVCWPLVVNNRPALWQYPISHVMIWEGDDYIHLNCPHLNIYWLDSSIIKDIPQRFFMTLDSELDLICTGQDFYIPRDKDDLYMADLSAPDKNLIFDSYGFADVCASRMWGSIMHRDTLKFFLRGMRVKINREIRPKPDNCMAEKRLKAEKTFLFNTILNLDPYKDVKLARGPRVHDGTIFV